MPKKDPRIDAYIAKSRDFAKPILKYLRSVVHEGCPECEETLKWGAPAFTHHGIIAITAAFKEHCAFVLWKHSLITPEVKRGAMGGLGRITTIDDLPSRKILVGYVKKAAKLNEQGIKSPSRSKVRPKKPVRVPVQLKAALAKNAGARTTFDGLSPSNKRDYCEWISEAKGEETRARRLKTAIEWMAAGKPRNWRYLER
jgi:uncharacterized protein YdeI (YjbR/CyaY-like superfamily)